MMSFRRCVIILFCLSPFAAQAQLFTDTDARNAAASNANEIRDIKTLVQDLNENIKQLRLQILQLTQQKQNLEEQVRALNGRMEEVNHLIDTANRQQLNTLQSEIIAVNKRLDEFSGSVDELRTELGDVQQYVTLPEEDELYQAAITSFKQEQYGAAIDGFMNVIKHYPNGQFHINARYWLGESYFRNGDYANADATANELNTNFPGNNKTPEAMLIIGRAAAAAGDADKARTTLQSLIEQHPTSLAADEARQILAE